MFRPTDQPYRASLICRKRRFLCRSPCDHAARRRQLAASQPRPPKSPRRAYKSRCRATQRRCCLLTYRWMDPWIGTAAAIDIAGDVDYIPHKTRKDRTALRTSRNPGQSLSQRRYRWQFWPPTAPPVAPLRPVAQEAAVMSGQAYCVVVASPTGYIGSSVFARQP